MFINFTVTPCNFMQNNKATYQFKLRMPYPTSIKLSAMYFTIIALFIRLRMSYSVEKKLETFPWHPE